MPFCKKYFCFTIIILYIMCLAHFYLPYHTIILTYTCIVLHEMCSMHIIELDCYNSVRWKALLVPCNEGSERGSSLPRVITLVNQWAKFSTPGTKFSSCSTSLTTPWLSKTCFESSSDHVDVCMELLPFLANVSYDE